MDKFDNSNLKGLNVCVYGEVPKSSGLSSSSALVVCSALTTLHANNLSLTRVGIMSLFLLTRL
jgi:galactokinase